DLSNNYFLIWSSLSGTVTIPLQNKTKNQTVSIPTFLTEISGAVHIYLNTMSAEVLDHKIINLGNGPPERKIHSFAGPKTILPDGKEVSMIVSVPEDSYGNPISDSLDMQYAIENYSGKSERRSSRLGKLHSYTYTSGPPEQGKMIIVSSLNSARSSASEIEVIPEIPGQITIRAEFYTPYANPRQYFSLTSEKILDTYGNQIPDGSSARILVYQGNKKTGEYSAMILDGTIQANVKNPDNPGLYSFKAILANGISSNTIDLEFEQYIISMPLEYNESKNTLTAGPIYGNMDEIIADGTPITFRIISESGELKRTIESDQGYAQYIIPEGFMNQKITFEASGGGIKTTLKTTAD
ncbi:MAG: hypothetical protein KJO29_09410, partial [Bacteroidia bacterium]|nr:hypothetical protein [Bacteroidia bacterium]